MSNNNSQESVGLSHSAFNQEPEVEEVEALPLLQMAPRELMELRWLKSLQGGLPEVDIQDVHALLGDPQAGRQFAAEYSQSSYEEILTQDYAIGDYLRRQADASGAPSNIFSYEDRERLVSIVQDLHKKKEYKVETLHLASSIADRYLSIILSKGKSVPNLFALGATVMLMAAKVEQPISPSFNRMIALLPQTEQRRISKQDLINLEEQILLTLEFQIHYVGPIPFLERYQRLLSLD